MPSRPLETAAAVGLHGKKAGASQREEGGYRLYGQMGLYWPKEGIVLRVSQRSREERNPSAPAFIG